VTSSFSKNAGGRAAPGSQGRTPGGFTGVKNVFSAADR
jgi:hypothetical protein